MLRMIGAFLACAVVAGACQRPIGEPGERIGFILIGTRDDLGYNEAVWEGADAVARAFPDQLVVRRENIAETEDAERTMDDLIAGGAGIVFATSYGHLEWAVNVARKHPGVTILHQGGILPASPPPNIGTYWGAVYEPVHLAGILAGAATRSGRIGYVVAFPIPATYDNVNAFTLGARLARADVQTDVVFTDDWCDPDAQRRAAAVLIARGADVLTQHQDCTRAILEAAEMADVRSVGYHWDGSEVAPRGWLGGAVWNWGPLFVDMVRTVLGGGFAQSPYRGDFVGTMKDGNNPFVLSEPGPSVSEDARARVEQARRTLASGGSPFTGPVTDATGRVRIEAGRTPSTDEILRMEYFVQGIEVVQMPDG